MSARMEKVREALGYGWAKLMTLEERDAALVEVEEWEADRAKTEGFVNDWGAESLANLRRAEAAEADADLVHETATIRAATLQAAHAANIKAAEAEAAEWKGHARRYKGELATAEADRDEQYQGRVAAIQKRDEFYDRLTVAEAEADRLKAALDRIAAIPGATNHNAALIARAALAPADRGLD